MYKLKDDDRMMTEVHIFWAITGEVYMWPTGFVQQKVNQIFSTGLYRAQKSRYKMCGEH
jgi:hypothetical protein